MTFGLLFVFIFSTSVDFDIAADRSCSVCQKKTKKKVLIKISKRLGMPLGSEKENA